ncbi:sugar ABC transporter permease [Maritimibacter fusiformis]|uniref:Sugar ABC transporter permease n=2 Tax=Maritimibacter fusiformis TaxID=2603819 RepID=A0A5D0R909_9RHOB|nr:sugar ABC transporter permease [Maritimibacter fusiformis]
MLSAAREDLIDQEPPRRSLAARLSSKAVAPWIFITPMLLFGAVFFILPLLYAFFISLTRWNSLSAPKWVGFKHYEYLLTTDPVFWQTFWNTMYFAAASIGIGVPLAMVLAYAFTRSKGRTVWRSIYWLPMITNVVAVAYIWKFVLDDRYGLLNRALGFLGLGAPGWLTDPNLALTSVVLIFVWMQLGHNMLLFSAGLASIDESYYEAARLDGANERQCFFRITVPLLMPTTLFVLITNFISGLSYFTLMLVLTDGNGGPLRSTTVTALYMYKMAFEDLRMGRASAVAYLLFAVILVITLI